MQVTEHVAVTRDIHVAPCIKCGGKDILLGDSNYSSFNCGGGKCKACGHEANSAVGTLPKMAELAAAWNASNDIAALIAAERAKIVAATQRILQLQLRAAELAQFQPRQVGDTAIGIDHMLTPEGQKELASFDLEQKQGFWATLDGVSEVPASIPQPAWATHVVWHRED